MKYIVIVMCFLLSSNLFAQQLNMQLIRWFAGADIVGTTGSAEADLPSDLTVREFELSAYSFIDQTWEGILTMAYHQELASSDEHFEVHEAFLASSKIFSLSRLRIGKFFLGFGRLNRFHRHDWVFTDAPMVQKVFFGNEGSNDTGIEYRRNFPGLFSTMTLGVTKGADFGHNHAHEHEDGEEAEVAKRPTGFIRFAKFIEFSTTKGLEVAVNYVDRLDAESKHYVYSGLDLIFKDRVGKYLNYLVQSELWTRSTTLDEDGEEETHYDIGGYLYFEKGIDRHHSYGLRLDYYKPQMHEEEEEEGHDHLIGGLEVDKELKVLSFSYNYTNSEFMKTRLTLEHGEGIKIDDDPDIDNYSKALVQFVFNIGAHPAHVY